MAASPEVQAMVALTAVLATGLASPPPGDWDYARTPVVRRAPLPPAGQQMKADECPVVYVVPGNGAQFQAITGPRDKPGKIAYRYDFNVDIWGIVFREVADPVKADDERLNLRSHVADVVMANRHLNGLSADGIRYGDRPEMVDVGEVAPGLLFVFPITIPLTQAFATVPA